MSAALDLDVRVCALAVHEVMCGRVHDRTWQRMLRMNYARVAFVSEGFAIFKPTSDCLARELELRKRYAY